MIAFQGSNWGDAFARGMDNGMRIGKQAKQAIAQSKYEDAIKEQDADEAEAKQAQDDIRQAKLDALNDPNGKYASWSDEDKKTAIAEMDRLRDSGYTEASRDSNVGRKQALTDYYAAIGDVANADRTKAELRQAQWTQKFWDGLKGNSAAYDDQMIADLNSDTIAKIQGIQYSKDENGNLITTQNGKMLGQPVQITDQMRAPFLQNLYSTQYNQEFGTAPTAQDATAWSTRKQAISTALQSERDARIKADTAAETVRHHKAVEESTAEKNAYLKKYLEDKGAAALASAQAKGNSETTKPDATYSEPDTEGTQWLVGNDKQIKDVGWNPENNCYVSRGRGLKEIKRESREAEDYGVYLVPNHRDKSMTYATLVKTSDGTVGFKHIGKTGSRADFEAYKKAHKPDGNTSSKTDQKALNQQKWKEYEANPTFRHFFGVDKALKNSNTTYDPYDELTAP